jgi:hypothetical protein
MGRVVSVTPQPRFNAGNWPPVPIVQEAGWASEPVWTQILEEKSFAPDGDQIPAAANTVSGYGLDDGTIQVPGAWH